MTHGEPKNKVLRMIVVSWAVEHNMGKGRTLSGLDRGREGGGREVRWETEG